MLYSLVCILILLYVEPLKSLRHPHNPPSPPYAVKTRHSSPKLTGNVRERVPKTQHWPLFLPHTLGEINGYLSSS